MSNNSNDITAKFYDITSSHFKGTSLSLEELKLIKHYCKKEGRILDIGCGTGRHLIPLIGKGFRVIGIDSSNGMLNVLRKKNIQDAIIIEADFLKYPFQKKEKFELIIMFWNTFNEICLTKKAAIELLKKCRKLLTPNGKILINSDNLNNINPRLFDFNTEDKIDGDIIEYKWNTFKYFKRTGTSISKEIIKINNATNYETIITQRWWTKKQYNELAIKTGFTIKELKINQNDELYLLLSRTKS